MTSENCSKKPRRRRNQNHTCHCCQKTFPFCWTCTCGFAICPACFTENAWGMSNGATWICPDCERVHLLE